MGMPPEHPVADIPSELPVLPLREFVVFPYMVLPLFLFREESIAAVEDALDLYRVGTVAMVMRILRLPDGRVKALVQGLSKAQIQAFVEGDAVRWARVRPLPEPEEQDFTVETEALMRAVRVRVEELLPFKNLPPEVMTITANVDDPGRLADLVASNLRLRLGDAQTILETLDPMDRLAKVDDLLRRELDVTTMQAELQSQVKDEMSRGQREVFLREQLRAIQAELGEGDARGDEILEYQTKLEEAGMPGEAFEESMRQLRRLERMHPDGPEAQVARTYLDWMAELPWACVSPDQLDLVLAREILDADHAHLDKIKDRILEFLGVR
ncbi:MAG: LON peptidase substrate-binding domain-containing protein, partial [Deltaproteobacteria bacterium]|nr:LON peptidase substrate-binding domain-containing protein [Deltaproteobacteria bacterium]